jgi:hypothetical protein
MKYKSISDKAINIIKSISGTFIPVNNLLTEKKTVNFMQIETKNNENNKNNIIILGYMDHDPKKEAIKNF